MTGTVFLSICLSVRHFKNHKNKLFRIPEYQCTSVFTNIYGSEEGLTRSQTREDRDKLTEPHMQAFIHQAAEVSDGASNSFDSFTCADRYQLKESVVVHLHPSILSPQSRASIQGICSDRRNYRTMQHSSARSFITTHFCPKLEFTIVIFL
jgi:hypothetical protein